MPDNDLTRPPLARALSTIANKSPDLSDVLVSGGSAWLSYLVFGGIDLSISVSPDAVTFDSDIADPEHLIQLLDSEFDNFDSGRNGVRRRWS